MKKVCLILAASALAVCLFAGCGNQPKQPASEVKESETNALGAAAKSKQIEPVSSVTVPVCGETQTGDGIAVSEAADKIEERNESPIFNTPQKDDSGAFIGGWCVTEQNGRSIPQPKINGELDFNQDTMIDSRDYELSGMNKTDFAEQMVKNGNVGTKGEAEMVMSGELAVMCGVIH